MHRESGEVGAGPPAPDGNGVGRTVAATTPPGRAWLRANPRPGAACLGAGVLVAALVAVAVRPWDAPRHVPGWILVIAPLVIGAAACAASGRPRLVRRADAVLVRLAPLRRETVPLEAVECFFLGSRLEPSRAGDTAAGARVRTLVMRLAERATTLARRPTLPAWGTWNEGSVTFDGRWCEPLSIDLVRRLNRELAAAKRAAGRR